ncbi:MFS transporter [Pseudokineococcus marinus]|uniref:MFS transporter n=2 Tax=Pseudokineococcus marinus TaxID=351215 RepID=A0A849BYF4_9ACTN|nr:MFS transporter [Pseudokineococcus marinus]
MAEFLPASLLPRIAEDLGVSTGAAGQSVTVTAAAAVLSALLLSAVLPRADRRRVMTGLTALAAASSVVVALAPTLAVLLVARLLLGVALGGFWAMAAAMAARLVPADHLGRALTVINSGVALATVVAVPLGSWLGEVWGWRGVFWLGAGVAALALVVQAATLPRVTPTVTGGLGALGATLRSGVVLLGLLAVLLVFGGHFSGFTYVRPAVESLSAVGAGGIAALMLVFGVAGVLGTALSGPLLDRTLRTGLLAFPALAGAGMLVVHSAGGSVVGLVAGVTLWGLGFGGVPTAVLTWGARTRPHRLEQIGGLVVTVCNVGIAVGGVVGGLLVDAVAPSAPLLVGGIVVVLGGVLLTGLRRRGDA